MTEESIASSSTAVMVDKVLLKVYSIKLEHSAHLRVLILPSAGSP